MNLWNLGLVLLAIGFAIPVAFAAYEFVLTPLEWYWRLSIISLAAGLIILLTSAVLDRLKMRTPKRKF